VSAPGGGWRGRGQGAEYYAYVKSLPFLETTVINGQLALSYKRAEK
jgi:hypothetical protein